MPIRIYIKEKFNLAINIVKDNDLKKPKVAKIKKKSDKQELISMKTELDKDPPVINILDTFRVNDTNYEISGTIIDKSKKTFIQINEQIIAVENDKFTIKRFSPIDEQIEIVAIDQWGNQSKPKIINVIVDIKDLEIAEKIEPLNPIKFDQE